MTLTSDTLFDLLMLKLKEAYTKKVKIESKGTVIYSKNTVASLPVQLLSLRLELIYVVIFFRKGVVVSSVSDPHPFYADPDPT